MRTKDELIDAATEKYGSTDIEIDYNAEVSKADDGFWVQAWVWLGDEDE